MQKPDIEVAEISVEILESSDKRRKLRLPENAHLLEALQEAAKRLHIELLPTSDEPLDQFRNFDQQGNVGEPLDLSRTVAEVLAGHDASERFGVELVLAIRVNARWAIATKSQMTPREITALFGLDYTQYTLYRPDSAEPLPLDQAIQLTRGTAFEAQSDGKYGAE